MSTFIQINSAELGRVVAFYNNCTSENQKVVKLAKQVSSIGLLIKLFIFLYVFIHVYFVLLFVVVNIYVFCCSCLFAVLNSKVLEIFSFDLRYLNFKKVHTTFYFEVTTGKPFTSKCVQLVVIRCGPLSTTITAGSVNGTLSDAMHRVLFVFLAAAGASVLGLPRLDVSPAAGPCLAPLQWEGRWVLYDHSTGRNSRAAVSYDGLNQRIRVLQQNKKHTPCQK